MLKAVRKMNEMKVFLEELSGKKIEDFRISYFLTGSIDVYILTNENKEEIEALFQEKFKDFNYSLEFIDQYNKEEYKELFETKDKILYGSKRSLRNAFRKIKWDEPPSKQIPSVVFYSYKGGIGRTTVLCLYAIYLAVQFKYKVVIIDCDLEAPGVPNFFRKYLLNEPQGGLVEYLLDSVICKQTPNLEDYSLEISKDLSGEGKIFIIPAGNLNVNEEHNHLKDYIEGLSRINFFYNDFVTESFQDFLEEVKKEFSPDILLFDSRTGINDMGVYLMTHHADLMVCFIGPGEQNIPGLEYVIQRCIYDNLPILLIHSILPLETGGEKFKDFNNLVEELIQKYLPEKSSSPAIPRFSVFYDSLIHNIGLKRNGIENKFFEQIKQRTTFNKYDELFGEISNSLNLHEVNEDNSKNEVEIKDIIESLLKEIPDLYADTQKATDEFLNKYFYVWSCFKEILQINHNKFLCIGSKGSGKTAIYKAMQNRRYMEKFFKKQKTSILAMASILEDQRDIIKYSTTDLIHKFKEFKKEIEDINWKGFWMVYTWNALNLYKEQIQKELGIELSSTSQTIEDFSSKSQQANTEFFFSKIQDSEYLSEIEKKLNELEKLLLEQKLNLILIYDQLDFIAEPIHWDIIVSPLINFFRMRRFKAIHPSLFLRRDLFNRLGRLTNKNNLIESFSIFLEWNKEEIFAMFFKIAWNSKELVKYLEQTLNKHIWENIQKEIQEKGQISETSTGSLKELARVFFGKYSGKHPSWGRSYNWFYLNLKNADDTISVRPFLDLIENALELAQEKNWNKPPIIPWFCYSNPNIRTKAVKRHYEDMVNEKGNEAVKKLFDFMQSQDMPKELLYIFLSERELKKIIQLAKEKKGIEEETEEVIQKLVNLGILAEPRHRRECLPLLYYTSTT